MTEPGLAPTRVRSLLVAAVLGGAATFLLLTMVERLGLAVPEVPWTTPVLLVAAAVAAAVLARVTRVRNHVLRRPTDPRRSLMTLAVARATLLGGALLAGGYAVYGLFFVPSMAAPNPRERVLRGLVTAGASVILVVAGWAAERACQTPQPPEDDEQPSS